MTRSAAPRPDILDTLTEGIASLTSSAEWAAHLATQARFHTYSFGNARLIALQFPGATHLAGFPTAGSSWVGTSARASTASAFWPL